jgi:hypothetical protein
VVIYDPYLPFAYTQLNKLVAIAGTMRRSTFFLAHLVLSASAWDPVFDFCQRLDHQSIVKDNILYIDGGTETFKSGGTKGPTILGVNQFLIEVGMSDSWDWKTNISETAITKEANPKTGTFPPSLLRGAMFQGPPGDTSLYIYGGTTSQLNSSFSSTNPDPSTYSLWSYDTNGKSWNQYDVTSGSPFRPSRGASAEAPDQGLGFFFNGQLDRGSSTQTTSMQDGLIALGGMVVLNVTETNKSARNISTSSLYSGSGAVAGSLTYISKVGEKGILVAMGGESRSTTTVSTDSDGVLVGLVALKEPHQC